MIKTYLLEESEKWDEIVKGIANYDVFYLSDYLKVFKLQGNGEPVLIVYSNGDDYAINAVFRRDIADDKHFQGKLEHGKYYDLSSPYGYGGFMGNVSDKQNLMNEWNQYCVEKGYVCEFVRFNLFSEYYTYFDGIVETHSHNVVRSLELSLDDMWMDFKQKVRKNVKKANKHELEIVHDSNGKYLDDFLRIYYGTMDRTEAKEDFYFTKEFFEMLNRMKDNVMYFHVRYKGIIISTELVIYGAENCYSYLGGTDREYFDMRPNDFLKYEIIKWAIGKGLKNFVLGGGYGSDDGIFQYKTCLAPNGIVDFYIGKKIFDEEVYQKLVDIRCKEKMFDRDSSYFPVYRSGGVQRNVKIYADCC